MSSDKDKPHVGARVSTRRRVIAGIAHSDTGTITRLEDGGYCVVRWDSDGESTSVLMMSLRPLADNSYSEGFDDAAKVARVLNSVADTSPETTITVESCLAELFRIKPLESAMWVWAETPIRRGYVCQPEHFPFYAFVFQSGRDGEWADQWCLDIFANGEGRLDAHLCASPEEGKQLAEQHWQEYVKQALVSVEE